MSLKSIIGDVAERSVSTGWQVAAGYVIATEVFHDPVLIPVVAAALSVVKSLAVWFYTEHKAEADKIRAQVEPIVAAAIKDYQSAQTAPAQPETPKTATFNVAQKATPSLAEQVIAATKVVG